jgi:L-asparaginase/Glu-tRNA(Gln) amidotransferase subunit D
LEGSPNVEETIYWLNLLIDTTVPIVGNASQQPHGAAGNDGDQNIIDAVDYIVSRVWADQTGQDRVGAVAIQNKQIFAAREVQKADARPGGYTATGGHGGIVGRISETSPATPTVLTFVPARRHTASSAVNLRQLPGTVTGVRRDGDRMVPVPVQIKDDRGDLLPGAIPKVTIVKEAFQYAGDADPDDPTGEVDILARIEKNLQQAALAGFVGEGLAPYGVMSVDADTALRRAVFSGMPVVKVGRGNADGFTPRIPPFLSGTNLTATKARLLLMACLMKCGSLPVAVDPDNPTQVEFAATMARLDEYQAVFDTH